MKTPPDAPDVVKILQFLKTSFNRAGFGSAVIALSGGVDSSVSCALTVRAIGQNNVYPLLLPHGGLNDQGVTDARLVIASLGIPEKNVTLINIQPFVDPIVGVDLSMDQVRRGNVMARVRMILLYDFAKKNSGLVVGTENKSEHLLGYFTRFGDEASDIEPLRNLYKTEVYALARQLNLPEIILTKAPTAGLWDGQTDENEFGFTYKDADNILSMIVDEKKSVKQVVSSGIKRSVVEKVVKRMKGNEFKHHLPMMLLDWC